MDLKLTNYDMDITDGLLSFVTGAEAIGQHITMRLRTWLGECVYDRSAGVPYLKVIFEKNTSIDIIEQILKQTILDTPGVLGVKDFELITIDFSTRVLELLGTATSEDGEIDFSGTFKPKEPI